MNRWIRGKEIKAEAEWTARWVFRYDKSPRKSLRSFFVSFSRFSPLTLPHSASVFVPPPPFRRPLILSFCLLSTLFPSCLFLFFGLLFFLSLRFQSRKKSRDFSTLYPPMRGSRGENGNDIHIRMNFPSTVIETPFSTCEVARLARHSEIFTSTADRVSLACRFKTAVEIVDFSTSNRLRCALPSTFYAFKFTIYI